ncbi:MAG TPA: hypothetical protein VHL50_06640 [Pyrinomonadaceae bacterium]|nr:hypothetical protein [Pyrinomonadaceae bacterium]
MRAIIIFGMLYAVVGIAFPNPSSSEVQFVWRLAAWLTCLSAFSVQIWFGHFRSKNRPRETALDASLSVALGAFALAVSANVHARMAGTGNLGLLTMALVIWPIVMGVPAFVLAFVSAAVFARMWPPRAKSCPESR